MKIPVTPMSFAQILGPPQPILPAQAGPPIEYHNSWQPTLPFFIGLLAGMVLAFSIKSYNSKQSIPLLKSDSNNNGNPNTNEPDGIDESEITVPNTEIGLNEIIESRRKRIAKRKEQPASQNNL